MNRDLRRSIWNGLGLTLLVVISMLAAVAVVIPTLVGASVYTITGRSMEPALPIGTLIVTQPVAIDEIRTGDVITFQLKPGQAAVATHRVTGQTFTGSESHTALITQGDNNAEEDTQAVRAEQIKGRLWYAIPGVGWLSALISIEVRAWVVPTAAFALLTYGLWMVGSGIYTSIRTRQRQKTADRNDAEEHGICTDHE